jgi:hypothetical protein
MNRYAQTGRWAALFMLPVLVGVLPAVRVLATDSDVLVTNVGGQVTIGGANNLEEADESFDLTSKVFYTPMAPNPNPLDLVPKDYGYDDPGFFGLGSTRTADFPAGASPLPAGANVTVSFPSFTVAGHTDSLFYWNGVGAVNFQPVSTSQPGVVLQVGASPVGTTSNTSPTDYGALHQHPGFTLDNGGAGVPADGVYLNAATINVPGLTDSKKYYYVWVIDSVITDSDKAADLRDQLLTHVNPPIEDGKDFTFVNNAIGYVQSNLVSVPEPSSFALAGILACGSFVSTTSRRRKSAVSLH